MKYYFLIRKQDGRVCSFSDGEIGYEKGIFDLKEIVPTEDEKLKLTQGFPIFMNNNKLEFREKPASPADLQKQIDSLKEEIIKLKQ